MQNFMKTIISAVQSWTKAEIRKIRTHWTEEGVCLVDNLTKEQWEKRNFPRCDFIEGEKYKVIFNGTVYDNLVCHDNSGYDCIASQYKGQPFYIDDDGGNGLWIEADGDWTVSIYGSVVHKLDPKYIDLPSNLATMDAVEEAMDVANSKMNTSDPVGTGSFSLNRKSNTKTGYNSVAIGCDTTASGDYSHAEGCDTTASGNYSHAEGNNTIASGLYSHAEGHNTHATSNAISSPVTTSISASGYYTHAEGYGSIAYGAVSHAEGNGTRASGINSHSEGKSTTASGNYAHAEGNGATASGSESHAEGDHTTASGTRSHAEGCYTTASGSESHAEGDHTTASGTRSHAEGTGSSYSIYITGTANSNTYQIEVSNSAYVCDGCAIKYNNKFTRIEQYNRENLTIRTWSTLSNTNLSKAKATIYTNCASGDSSHAEGSNIIAGSPYQHAQGKNNIPDTTQKYAHIVGNGTYDYARSNAHTLDWNGVGWYQGGLQIGGTSQDGEGVGYVPAVPAGVQPGQVLSVKTVDENGKPTEWETVDMVSGGGAVTNEQIVDVLENYLEENPIEDGKTPIKGEDYFTEADKTEMVSAVIAALPKYNGEVVAE